MSDELEMDGDPDFDAFVYEASENVRQHYEAYAAALGRCMFAFNQLDYQLEKIIGLIHKRLGAPKLPDMRFDAQVKYLDSLKRTKEGRPIAIIPIDELREIAPERGKLAHAHFETSGNPGDDSYRLVNKEGRDLLNKDRRVEIYDATRIDGFSERIHRLGRQLYTAELAMAFGPLPKAALS